MFSHLVIWRKKILTHYVTRHHSWWNLGQCSGTGELFWLECTGQVVIKHMGSSWGIGEWGKSREGEGCKSACHTGSVTISTNPREISTIPGIKDRCESEWGYKTIPSAEVKATIARLSGDGTWPRAGNQVSKTFTQWEILIEHFISVQV